MTGPVLRWALSLQRRLHIAKAAHQAALGAVARKEAELRDVRYQRDEALSLVTDLRADLEAQEQIVRALMETAPSDVGDIA